MSMFLRRAANWTFNANCRVNSQLSVLSSSGKYTRLPRVVTTPPNVVLVQVYRSSESGPNWYVVSPSVNILPKQPF